MKMNNPFNKELIIGYIYDIWNKEQFERLLDYIHSDFIDHSLPPQLPTNSEGLMLWIMGTSKAFEHKTTIEDMVCEGDKVMIKIRMTMKHIGIWRNIEPTGATISTMGYRHFRIKNGRIIEHWALIDGASIENQIKNTTNGCKIHV
jgi:predicted ester cyclase